MSQEQLQLLFFDEEILPTSSFASSETIRQEIKEVLVPLEEERGEITHALEHEALLKQEEELPS